MNRGLMRSHAPRTLPRHDYQHEYEKNEDLHRSSTTVARPSSERAIGVFTAPFGAPSTTPVQTPSTRPPGHGVVARG